MHDYDVVVVGGGCAGLWAAHTAALGGARTLLVERDGRIGEKIICAEAIGTAGVGQFTELSPACVAASIDGARLFDPHGRSVEIDEAGCGYVLNKELFLRKLAVMAASSGAEIRVGTEVETVRPVAGGLALSLKGPGGQVMATAGAVVAADGIECRIGRQLGIQRALKPFELFSCAQYTLAPVDVDRSRVEFHFGRAVAPGGYAWVFPKEEGVANVGVGVICSGEEVATPLECLKRFKAARYPGAKIVGCVFGGVPAAKRPFRIYGHGIFLAGDAGRVADPVSGAGIVPGMETAALAARAAVDHSRDGSNARSVEREFAAGLKHLFKDRSLRFAVRQVLSRMTDDEVVTMLQLAGDYASKRSLLKSDPFSFVTFMLKAMPRTFGLLRHLVEI